MTTMNITVLGDLNLTVSPGDPAPVIERLDSIMNAQDQLVLDISAVTDGLVAATAKIEKIGAETDALNASIAALQAAIEAAGATSNGVLMALATLKAQAAVLAAATQTVDDKVPDAPAPVEPPAPAPAPVEPPADVPPVEPPADVPPAP